MDDIQFQNMDSWRGGSSGKFGLTFKQIALSQVNRCVLNGSVEWHGGYWQERSSGQYTIEKVYIQNSREVYCNSVKMLRALLLGFFDKKMENSDKKIQEDMKALHDKFLKKSETNKKSSKPEYYDVKIDLHIRLFEELIKLCRRLNFFAEETSEEDM